MVLKFICLANRSRRGFSPAEVDACFSLIAACRFYGSNQTTAKFYSIPLNSEHLRLLKSRRRLGFLRQGQAVVESLVLEEGWVVKLCSAFSKCTNFSPAITARATMLMEWERFSWVAPVKYRNWDGIIKINVLLKKEQ